MIKELFLAIILGSLLGFGLTGSYLALKPKKPATTVTPTPTISSTISPPSTSPSPTETLSDFKIIIDSPVDQSITATSKTKLTGSSSADTTIIIQTSTRNYQTVTDKNGNFSLEIDLESGANLIKIIAVDSELQQTETSLLITYSTAQI